MKFVKIDLTGILFFLYVRSCSAKPHDCDPGKYYTFQEGNLGQSRMFPWLGVLKVHMHDKKPVQIAITGIVLVKENYAIANAHDISKIPPTTFRKHGKAMFMPHDNHLWYRDTKDYTTNPEYEYSTFNTIALIELVESNMDNKLEDFPFNPACWPIKVLENASDHLYVIGYTDEHRALEKTVYKMSYVEPEECTEFYKRLGEDNPKMTPLHYLCGFTTNKRERCQWDNGMVLATNATGSWVIVGLSINGPGCAAPGRFLDLSHYLTWVQLSTELSLDYGFRRAGEEGRQLQLY